MENLSEKPCEESVETIISILEEAIQSEVESEEKYLHGAKIACDPTVRDFFISLASMEHDHKEQLTKQLGELRAQMKIVEEMNDMFS